MGRGILDLKHVALSQEGNKKRTSMLGREKIARVKRKRGKRPGIKQLKSPFMGGGEGCFGRERGGLTGGSLKKDNMRL